MRAGILVGLILGLVSWIDATAQEWHHVPDATHSKSVVKIVGTDGVEGSGTVVRRLKADCGNPNYYIGLILTAAHCVTGEGVLFEVEFYNKLKTKNNRCVQDNNILFAPDNDLAVIRALIPCDVPVVEMADSVPNCGDSVMMSGYGAGKVRHWHGLYGGKKLGSGGHIIFSWAIQGDSGGGVFHDGKLIGVICYGNGLKRFKDTQRLVVSPVNASNVARIKEYIDTYQDS